MKSFLFLFSVLALLAMTKSLPCIGDSCGRQSPLYPEYDDDDGGFYIQENSPNSASSNDDDNNHEDPKKEDNFGFRSAPLFEQQLLKRPIYQRPNYNYQRGVGPKTGQSYHPSNQQPFNPSPPHYDNQETEYTSNPDRNNEGKFKSGNQGGNGGHYQNNGAGSNGRYPGSLNQDGGGGYYQNSGRYPDRESSCPNCYATDFGNGDYNQNVINIEK